ncbi:MAG: ammonia-forming cytochrome c nitrite reductase subunit c552 [Thermoplasmata archaeon]
MTRREIAVAIGVFAALVTLMALVHIGTSASADGVRSTRGEADNSYMDTATYIGSDQCAPCHNNSAYAFKYDTWQGSLHSMSLQDPSTETIIPPIWNGALNLTEDGIWGNITLHEDSGTYHVDLGSGHNYTVWKVMGVEWKQRYVTEIGNSKYTLPLQWNVVTAEWVPYDLGDWFDTPDIPKTPAYEHSWDRQCAGCHTTGTTIAYVGAEWVANYSETAVGCEACHGPGGDHSGDPNFIWRSADSRICGQCHGRGASVATEGGMSIGWPWGADGKYHPGDDITDYLDRVDPINDPDAFWPNNMSRIHLQQYIDWAGSAHANALTTIATLPFGEDACLECHSADYWLAEKHGDPLPTKETALWSIECARCHNPHGNPANDKMLWKSEDETCEQCHNLENAGPGDTPHHPNTELIEGNINVTGLDGSPWMNGDVECTDCHMVLVATSAVLGDIPSHTFGFANPQETIDHGMPNGCTSYCHDGVSGSPKTDQKAVNLIDEWKANYTAREADVGTVIEQARNALIAAEGLGFNEEEIAGAQTAFDDANFSYEYVLSDRSGGVHNNPFQMAILDYAETTAQSVIDDLTPVTTDGEEAPLDMMWIYLALAVIIIIVVIIAVVAASRRRGAPPEEPYEEEEPPTIE